MIQQQFQTAANNELNKINSDDYVNARFAPNGNQTEGSPFLAYKEFGGRFTDWTPNSQTVGNMKNEMHLPTNNSLFRNAQINNGVSIQNDQNTAWLYRTQTLANNGGVRSCVSDVECSQFPGTTCNSNYQDWDDVKGNQGNFCSKTFYPELESGIFNRKNVSQGGIGKACNTDNDCGSGYSCNNDVNIFGKNVKQTGYCSQTYDCGGSSKRHLAYPEGSGTPVPPPPEQNNYGKGYTTAKQCNNNKSPGQHCVADSSGRWFATYPGFCPVSREMTHSGATPLGALSRSSASSISNGIGIPASSMFGSLKSSNHSQPKQLGSFSAWNNSESDKQNSDISSPLQYEMSINSAK